MPNFTAIRTVGHAETCGQKQGRKHIMKVTSAFSNCENVLPRHKSHHISSVHSKPPRYTN